ncbi:hypothetical protein D7T57_21145 [Stenotrophomonas maltophilia]|nr:hypothetical protein [Stenotrophomonas maltophilia]
MLPVPVWRYRFLIDAAVSRAKRYERLRANIPVVPAAGRQPCHIRTHRESAGQRPALPDAGGAPRHLRL